MLLQTRTFAIAELDTWSRRRTLYTPTFRVEQVEHHNRTTEGALIQHTAAHRRAAGRSQLSVVVRGPALVRHGDQRVWLGPGDAVAIDDVAQLVSRNEPDAAGDFVCLDLEWEPGSLGPRVPRFAVERLTLPAADELLGTLFSAPAETLSVMLSALRPRDFSFAALPPEALVHTPDPRMVSLSAALDRALNAGEAPTVVDLEVRVGVPERDIRRLMTLLVERYRLRGGSNWREMRNHRINEAAFSMTAPGATTERIAKAFGFHSASALCLAFSKQGLPSPGSVPRVVAMLRGESPLPESAI